MDDEEKWLCHACVGEAFLKNRIQTEGQTRKCTFCARKRTSMPLEDVADAFETVFEEHLVRTSDQPSDFDYLAMKESDYIWGRAGDPISDVLQEIGEIEENVAEAIREVLNERHADYDSYKAQEECEFDEDSHYAYTAINTRELSGDWSEFTEDLKTGSRYFNRTAERILTHLFDGINEYTTEDGRPILANAGPRTEYPALYRARVFQNSEHLEQALNRPDLGIGSPPPRLAASGRMNARGISVFYGATSREVALAEVRPFVGSRVVTAKFDLIRPLRLLDIEAFKSISLKGSLFDPSFGSKAEKVEFLGTLSRLMTAPVMPDDEPFEYLPTQAIADFFAASTEPGLDGIIYPSAQGEEAGRNVVLFHKAALVERMEFPEGTEIRVQLETQTEDGPEADYWVWEETPSVDKPAEKQTDARNLHSFLTRPVSFDLHDTETREPALRIVGESVEVHHVTHIRYEKDDHKVKRHRFEKRIRKF